MLQENLAALNELLETLVNKRLRVQFQPIVDLTCTRSRLLTSVSSSSFNRSEEHTSELQSRVDLVCRLLPEKKQNHALAAMSSSLTQSFSFVTSLPGYAAVSTRSTTSAPSRDCCCFSILSASARCSPPPGWR